MTEIELIEKAVREVGIKSLLNHGAASCIYSEGCNGVTQDHLVALVRKIALHCAVALAAPSQPEGAEPTQYQYRNRLHWNDNEGWSPCKECSKAQYELCLAHPRVDGFDREARMLYAHPSAPVTSTQAVAAWNKLMEVTAGVFDEAEGNEVMRWVRTYAQLQYEAGLAAGAAAPDEGEGWQPIETAPLGATMFVVRAFEVLYGSTDHVYTSDPYCVWQAKKGLFSRWPHPFAPTHWMPLPSAPKGEEPSHG